jgi:DNA-binding IclR family transcriptional regulator
MSVKSADRVLDVLELLSRRSKPLSHTDIAGALGIPKSSLTQLLRNLTAREYLVYVPGPNTYALGPSLFAVVRQAREQFDIIDAVRPILNKLTAKISESSSFNAYRDDHVERVCGVDSPHALTYRMTAGTRFSLYSSSGGKAVLAALPDVERERYLSRVQIERYTKATVKSVAELRRELTRIRKEGIAYSRGEQTPGIVAIATAVRRSDGYPIGALTVATPSVRFDANLQLTCVRALRAATTALERELQASETPTH